MTFRTTLAGLLAVCIGLLPLAPREHVHDIEAPDGHHETVAHRHADAHRVGHDGHRPGPSGQPAETPDHHAALHADHDAGVDDAAHPAGVHVDTHEAIDHAESVMLELDAAFTRPTERSMGMPAVATVAFAVTPVAPTQPAREPFVDRLNHGPPAAPTAPRPPPSLSRL